MQLTLVVSSPSSIPNCLVTPHKEIKIPPRIAHLLIALEDSVFVETITDINDVTIVPEYRKVVNELMNEN